MPVSHPPITAGMLLSAVVATLALMNYIYWTHRLAAYRKDRAWERTTYGLRFESGWGTFNRSNYTDDAGRAYIAFIVSYFALIGAVATVIWAWA
jgi:hypothetical protein